MTTLREILEQVASRPTKTAPFSELRAKFNGDLTGLRVALDRGLLELRGDCYFLTVPGTEFVGRPTLAIAQTKICYQCQRELTAEQFWKCATSGDGLFDICITCGKRKKRKAMEARRKLAESAVLQASQQAMDAAVLWDKAVSELASAWRGILAADVVIRENLSQLGSENDSGRLHARTTFPRAAYSLNLALSDAGYPNTSVLLREVGFPAKLADYIGEEPHTDYLQHVEADTLSEPEAPRKRGRHAKAS